MLRAGVRRRGKNYFRLLERTLRFNRLDMYHTRPKKTYWNVVHDTRAANGSRVLSTSASMGTSANAQMSLCPWLA